MNIKSVGFPRMHKDVGEKRDFLPEFFGLFTGFSDKMILVEEGYGAGMGYSREDYLAVNPEIHFVSHEEAYKTDLVIVLRSPEIYEIDWMKKGAVLLSMLHFDTREFRNGYLGDRDIYCYSMDSIKNDNEVRLVVNYYGTAYAGASIAFKTLKKNRLDFYALNREPLIISIMGFGSVGLNAAKAFKNLSNLEFLGKDENVPGVIIKMITRSITGDENQLKKILPDTDILVDATWRSDPSIAIVSNELLGLLPEHGVILDLTADPYKTKIKPIQIKGIEGIPTGTLSHFVIEPGDSKYQDIPSEVNQLNKRTVVSCNAWPGVYPVEAMDVYGKQLRPFIKILLKKGTDLDVSEEADQYERALKKASLEHFEQFGIH
ncbi:MAG: alanine dehydrogenase [Peptostreptococcaceae bacterium]|nr:alanine dehydrogenase [Peptostreptococcaceae bacterium]